MVPRAVFSFVVFAIAFGESTIGASVKQPPALAKRDAPITACPVSETPLNEGATVYVTCPNTDYHTGSVLIAGNTATIAGCAKACSMYSGGCTNAVYDKTNQICHIKPLNSGSVWTTSTSGQYDSLRVAPTPVAIKSCTATTYPFATNGQAYTVCPNSDFHAPSFNILNGYTSATQCAQQCATVSGCQAGVYDKLNSICHLKGAYPGLQAWFTGSQYDSFQLTSINSPSTTSSSTPSSTATLPSTPSTPSTNNACPVGSISSSYTAKDGLVYQICSNADYQANTWANIPGISTVQACAEACSTTFGCTKAVFDPVATQCLNKGTAANVKMVQSTRYSTVTIVQPSMANKAGTTEVIGTCGVSAQHLFVGGDDIIYIADKSENNPLRIPNSGYAATAAAWSLSQGTCRPMVVPTNQFCAAGGPMGDGSWMSAGGNPEQNGQNQTTGLRAIRRITPCQTDQCQWNDSPSLQLQVDRWYPSAETVSDGSMIIFGGYNAQVFMPYPQSGNTPTAEYYPSRGAPINVPVLDRAWPFSLYPLVTTMSDGRYFIVVGNQTALFDANKGIDSPLPNVPHGPRTYPGGGSSVLFPLSPANNYQETIMFCGGTNLGGLDQWGGAYCPPPGSDEVPANAKCDIMTPLVSPTWGSAPDLPAGRVMGNFIILPDSTVALVNGAHTGVQGFGCGFPSESQAQNPANEVLIYDPTKKTWTQLATAIVNRGYHSTATLLPDGSILTAGSAPHNDVWTDIEPWPTEFRLEKIYPSYYSKPRPDNSQLPTQFGYGGTFSINFNSTSDAQNAFVRLIRTGWSTHGLQMGQRSYELQRTVSGNTVTYQGINKGRNIFPPGAALAFVVVNGVPSIGKYSMVG